MHFVKQPTFDRSVGAEIELYWLAGLLEGEGSFLKGPPSSPDCPIVQLAMTDNDVVERAARLFARCVTPWDRRSARPRKRVHATRIKGVAAAIVMRTMFPLMGERRQRQIEVALSVQHAARLRSLIRGINCAVPGCERQVRTRGLCRQHYGSWWKSTRRRRVSIYTPVDILPPAAAIGRQLEVVALDDERMIAWLAGLLEGEGTFANAGGYPDISAQMCDRDVLERAATIMGIRRVSAKDVERNAIRGWSPAFKIGITGARAADWMRRLRPLMGDRRSHEIDRALGAYHPIRLVTPPQQCVVTNCGKQHRSRGLCHKHYMQWDRDRKAGRIPRVAPLR